MKMLILKAEGYKRKEIRERMNIGEKEYSTLYKRFRRKRNKIA